MRNFTIDNVSCFDYMMALTKRNLRAIPEVKITEIDIGGMDGIVDGSFKYGKNTVKLSVECYDSPDKIYDNIRKFISFLNPKKGYRKLVFDDEPNYYRLVRLINTSDIDYFYSQYLMFGSFELEFKMADPFTYAKEAKHCSYDLSGGSAASLINGGGIECPVIINIRATKGTISNPKIYINDEFVQFKSTLALTDQLVIDTKEYTFMLNGYTSLKFWGGDFPILKAGENAISETDDGNIGALVTFEFTERWL